ncbi:partial putative signaling protein, partial [Gallionellaceae bacterium]
RKCVEELLSKSETRLRLAQASGGITTWEADLVNNRQWWSENCISTLGFPTLSEPTWEDFLSVVHPDDRQRMINTTQSHIEHGTAYDVEFRVVGTDGTINWLHSKGQVERDADGKPVVIRGISDIITDRKQAEEVLRRANEQLELAQNAAECGIWDWDITAGHFEWTPGLFKLFGLDPTKDMPGYKSLQSVLHPEDRETASKRTQIALQDDVPLDWVYRIVRRDNGEVRWIHFIGRTLFDESRQPLRMIGICIDVTERKSAEEEIHNLAFFDPLTKLPNRRLLLDRLQQCMAASARSINYQALLFLDLDDFKIVNDSLGHDVGDKILAESASRLQSCIREDDTVSRLGGDEFVALLVNLSEDIDEAATQAKSVAEKILSRFREPYSLDNHVHHGSTSIGITLFHGREVLLDELLQRADLAMYQAKAAGRNTLRFFDPGMQASITARTTMEKELRRAVGENEFVLHAQPQVDATGRCTGVEVLVRWENPNRGLVLPAEFIPLAEETGLILPIGAWVLKEACYQLVAWQHNPATAHLSIAVNVSPKQFRLPNFVEEIHSMIQQSGANPALLKLEITESMLLDDVENVIIKMSALKGIGVSFSLDDFGTGYSSLSYLKRLPLDQVKIDRSFVRDVLIDPNDAAICRAIIALGNSLGLRIIAEGVETVSQWNFLKSEGCAHAQGFLFAKPMLFDELHECINTNWRTRL